MQGEHTCTLLCCPRCITLVVCMEAYPFPILAVLLELFAGGRHASSGVHPPALHPSPPPLHALLRRPHVNIVSGTNGSGKSAVVQALQCCLGVRAADTSRFRSMGQFIRQGQSACSVAVTVWNVGGDAYM